MSFDFASFRNTQVASNEELANTTGLSEARQTIKKSAPKPKAAAPRKPRQPKAAATKKRKADQGEEVIQRRSTRSRIAKADTQEEKDRINEANEKEEDERQAELYRRKHESRKIDVMAGVRNSGDQETFDEMMKGLASFRLAKKEEEGDEGGWKLGERFEVDAEELKEHTSDLELRSIVKVVPERIYALCVHPDETKDLIFSGDKGGHIGLWDATTAGQRPAPSTSSIKDGAKKEMDEGAEEEGEEEESNGTFWVWSGHNSTVSCLKFRPQETKKIYSGSYDATIRSHDFETGISEEVIAVDEWTDNGLVHSFDFDPTGNEIWASDSAGGLNWRDLRAPKNEGKRWQIDKAKVGCVSLNPARPDLAVTAHLKRDMRIWDLSKLRGLDTDLDSKAVVEQAMIVDYSYTNAVTSAYFDPSGTKLLTTCYDDCLRVWDIDPHNFEKSIEKDFEFSDIWSHDCQVGRFVTVLRAFWSPLPPSIAPPHVHVGDMKHAIDIYSPSHRGKDPVRQLTAPGQITAVPAVTAMHPTVAKKYYGGSASGKVSFWCPPPI